MLANQWCVQLTAILLRARKEWATEHVHMRRNDDAIFFSRRGFLFILIIVVFLTGENVPLETILRSRTEVSDFLVVVDLWSMLASPLISPHISISFGIEL